MTPRSGVAAATAVLTLLLAGCSDPDGTARSGDPGEPGSTSPTASPSATEAPAETEATAQVAPATGPVILVQGLRVRAPQGWRSNIRLPIGQGAFPVDRPAGTLVQVYRFPNGGLFQVDELANAEVKDYGPKAERRTNVTVDGASMYHITGTGKEGERVERFGTIVDDQRVSVTFYFGHGEKAPERDTVVQSVLASARLG